MSKNPQEDPIPLCEVCGIDTDACRCPECPVCGYVGNPACTINGGEGCNIDWEPDREYASLMAHACGYHD